MIIPYPEKNRTRYFLLAGSIDTDNLFYFRILSDYVYFTLRRRHPSLIYPYSVAAASLTVPITLGKEEIELTEGDQGNLVPIINSNVTFATIEPKSLPEKIKLNDENIHELLSRLVNDVTISGKRIYVEDSEEVNEVRRRLEEIGWEVEIVNDFSKIAGSLAFENISKYLF